MAGILSLWRMASRRCSSSINRSSSAEVAGEGWPPIVPFERIRKASAAIARERVLLIIVTSLAMLNQSTLPIRVPEPLHPQLLNTRYLAARGRGQVRMVMFIPGKPFFKSEQQGDCPDPPTGRL